MLSRTLTIFHPPTNKAATMATIRQIRVNMAICYFPHFKLLRPACQRRFMPVKPPRSLPGPKGAWACLRVAWNPVVSGVNSSRPAPDPPAIPRCDHLKTRQTKGVRRHRKIPAATAGWPAGGFSVLLCAMNETAARQLRALLALSRVSNLPTVWSNCLAGWWLGGHGNFGNCRCCFLGVSALYTGGMFLNDAFDADFDRQRRAERPIPSGAISLPAVWRWGLGWLGAGHAVSDRGGAGPRDSLPWCCCCASSFTTPRTRSSPRRRG